MTMAACLAHAPLATGGAGHEMITTAGRVQRTHVSCGFCSGVAVTDGTTPGWTGVAPGSRSA